VTGRASDAAQRPEHCPSCARPLPHNEVEAAACSAASTCTCSSGREVAHRNCPTHGRSAASDRESLIEDLRRNGDNLPHLLDVTVQILEDEGLLSVFEEVVSLDIEAARDDA